MERQDILKHTDDEAFFHKQTVLKEWSDFSKKKATSRRISAIVSKAKAKILEIKNWRLQ